MRIQQTRIRKVDTHLSYIDNGESFRIALDNIEDHKGQLLKIGFTDNLEPGEQVLPRAIGNISEFNAHGKYEKHTDEPMETAYHQREWHWEDWGGNEHSKIVDVPYKRYPRDFIEPPSEELMIIELDDSKIVTSETFVKEEDNYEHIKHIINLFLEIFGECVVLNEDYDHYEIPKVKRLNWEILPPGEYPWEEVQDHVRDGIEKAPEGKRPVIVHRIKTITKHDPTYVAVGEAGFEGYWVFGWPDEGIYILENSNYGNATYVFGEDWKKYSELSKRDIINGDLHKHRFIHKEGWPKEIDHLLN